MRRPAASPAGISLFPFLAVLLCTMGALIVVLVVLNRQSRLAAMARAAEEAKSHQQLEAASEDRELARGAIEWQLEHLRTSRDKTQRDLDHARLKLAGVEEHQRSLEKRLRELQAEAKNLEKLGETNEPSRAAEEADLSRLAAEIVAARERLRKAQTDAANQPPSYAVVPYDGPSRTRRRPIYIECRGDRVVIQPEGIVLRASDFSGPAGPGNPLASAIRAAREHLQSKATDPKSPEAEPYPLFIVRPDGVEAYYAARAAMASWGSDFGYQMVDQDWKLEYPPSDAQLAEVERKAVEDSRERMRWLVAMTPDRYSGGSSRNVSYRVSPLGGGLVPDGAPSMKGQGGNRIGQSKPGRNGEGSSFGAPESDTTTDAAFGLSSSMGDNGTTPSGKANATTNQSPELSGEVQDASQQRLASRANAAPSMRSVELPSERRYGDLNDRPRSEKAPTVASFERSGTCDTDPETGQASCDRKVQSQKQKPISLAETRGRNWGLASAVRSSNPITRPIHILCESDKLVIRPDKPSDPPVVVPVPMRTDESVDQLVTAVQDRIKTWGIAGRGLYWRPQLILEVGHSGEGRFAELEALLADSGFDIIRKQ